MKIKFITLNLYEGGLLFDNILAFFNEEKPDIIAVQEVYDGKDNNFPRNLRSMEILHEFFKNFDYRFSPEFLEIRAKEKVDIGNAIFSRFPIQKSTVNNLGIPYGEYNECPIGEDFSKHPKNIQCCDININGQKLRVCNLHGIWGLDGEDNEARLKMSEIIINQIKDQKNVILAGDFNIRPNTKTILNIEHYLINLFKDELKTTFNLSRKDLVNYPGYENSVVDMIFASNHLKVNSHYCPQVDISDHLPLVCEFEI